MGRPGLPCALGDLGLAPWSITTRRSGCRSSSRRRFGSCGGRTSASKVRSAAVIARRPSATLGPSIQSTSGMSWSIGRSPSGRAPGRAPPRHRGHRARRAPPSRRRPPRRAPSVRAREGTASHPSSAPPGPGRWRRSRRARAAGSDRRARNHDRSVLLGGQPPVVAPREAPEMLVRVDAPGPRPRHPGVGASGRTRPAVLRSRQSAAGTGTRSRPRFCSTSDGARAPGMTAATAGWWKGNWSAAAASGTPCVRRRAGAPARARRSRAAPAGSCTSRQAPARGRGFLS